MIRYNGYIIRGVHLSERQLNILKEAGAEVEVVEIPKSQLGYCSEIKGGIIVYNITIPSGARISPPPELHRKKEKRVTKHGFRKERFGKAEWEHFSRRVSVAWREGEDYLSHPTYFTKLSWVEESMPLPVD